MRRAKHKFNFVRRLSALPPVNSLFKYTSQPEIAKNSQKNYFGGLRSSTLVLPESSSAAVLVTISSKSVSICSHSDAR